MQKSIAFLILMFKERNVSNDKKINEIFNSEKYIKNSEEKTE